jgi:predicted SAM-dependent methyltransferase
MKLHLGCGRNFLPNWINTDLDPQRADVQRLDVTQVFPYKKESVSYVFCEHLIEHLTFEEGQFMLKECYRILHEGGVIRVATPSIDWVASFLQWPISKEKEHYLTTMFKLEQNWPDGLEGVFFVNHFMRAWGHKFLYDHMTLEYALENAGFNEIEEVEISQSVCPELRNLENVGRMPPGFLEMETFIMEGIKI